MLFYKPFEYILVQGEWKKPFYSMNELPDVLNTLIASLKPILSSYMEREEDDLIDFGNEPFHEALSYKLGAMLNLQINIHDEAANQFCVDSIIPRVGMVSEGGRFTCWGIIYWLSTPKDYPINKSGKDPFYCAFESDNGQLRLLSMCCGDYNLTNVDKYYLLHQVDFDWIFSFSE